MPSRRLSRLVLWVLICFFFSGLTGLMYQLLWTRMIVKIIGGAPFAVSIILTIFMGGLGLGSFLVGRWIDRIENPRQLLRLYGVLEIAIAGYALAIPALLHIFQPLYAAIYNELAGQFLLYHLLTFAGCALLLLFPVICMGATLPILCRFYVSALAHLGTHTGRLYGLNTLGAAIGALICGFWLISLLGMAGTLAVAVAINAIIGLSCVVASCLGKDSTVPMAPAAHGSDRTVTQHEAKRGTTPIVWPTCLVVALSGFCAMAYEVIWTRLLGLLVGPTTYSFTIVLVTFITGLAFGSVIFGRLADRTGKPFGLLIGTQVAAALLALGVSQIVGNSQLFFAKLIYTLHDSFLTLSVTKGLVLFGFLVLPTICLGGAFPLAAKLYTRDLKLVGRSIGAIYAINTIGAVLGSFMAGFVLIPLLGKERSISFVVGMQLLIPLIVAVIALARNTARRLPHMVMGSCAVVGLVLCVTFPKWDRTMLSVGKYHRFEQVELVMSSASWIDVLFKGNHLLRTLNRNELVYYGDGIGGFTTVIKEADAMGRINFNMANSGKFDASTDSDMATQTLLAHLPMLFHPDAKHVLVVGLASGITAGEVLHYPVEQLDIVDINDQVVDASQHFSHWNNNVLADPRSTLIIQDGRAHLQLTNKKYDVIISEPSNPWMAGLATLFTRECFTAARDRLNDGGIFVQFMHAYEMDWPTFSLVGRTFAKVFPNSVLVQTTPDGEDFLLIGFKSQSPQRLDGTGTRLIHAIKSHNVRILDVNLLYRLFVSNDLETFFGSGPENTDGRPRLEFSAPRLMHNSNDTVQDHIKTRRALHPPMKQLAETVANDTEVQIAFAEFALSVFHPFQRMLDLARVTPQQKERFCQLMEQYSASHVINYALISNPVLATRCRDVQIKELNAKMADFPNPALSFDYLGELYFRSGQMAKSASAFRQSLKIRPDHPEAHYDLAMTLNKQGQTDAAADQYREALNLWPGFTVARINLGTLLGNADQVDKAIAEYHHGLDVKPNDVQVRYALAKLLAQQGKTDQSMAELRTILRIQPTFSSAHRSLGGLLAIQGNLRDATVHYQRAVTFDSDHTLAHFDLAQLLVKQDQLENAISHYRQALRIEPQFAAGHYRLAQALERKGHHSEAVTHFQHTVRLKPQSPSALNELAWIRATCEQQDLRNADESVRLAEQACTLTGHENPHLLNTLGAAYAEAGRITDAIHTAQHALRLLSSTTDQEYLTNDIRKRLQHYQQAVD